MISQTLLRRSPLTTAARPQAAPPLPPRVEPNRTAETFTTATLFGVAALAVAGTAAVLGGVGSNVVQEVAQQVAQPMDRNGAPISQEHWGQMKAAGTVHNKDNDSARETKEAYLSQAEALLPEADLFQQQGKTLETTARWLRDLASQFGPGTHQVGTGTLTVTDSGVVTLNTPTSHKHVSSYGDLTIVLVTEGDVTTRMEDSSTSRSISEGDTTRTLFIQDTLLHRAGEFEVRTGDQVTTLQGTTITHQSGRDASSYELTDDGTVSFKSVAGSVEVRPDGSTIHRHNGTQRTAPAQANAPVTMLLQ